MKQIFLISIMILTLTAVYGYAQMGEGMMGSEMMGEQGLQQSGRMPYTGSYYPCPHMMGQGMMGSGYGGHMMGSGYGGHMMGSGYGGHMMGQGMMGSGNAESYKEFLDDTVDLRKKLHNKQFDYFEATRNPNTKPETITKLKKEIRELQIKIFEKAPL